MGPSHVNRKPPFGCNINVKFWLHFDRLRLGIFREPGYPVLLSKLLELKDRLKLIDCTDKRRSKHLKVLSASMTTYYHGWCGSVSSYGRLYLDKGLHWIRRLLRWSHSHQSGESVELRLVCGCSIFRGSMLRKNEQHNSTSIPHILVCLSTPADAVTHSAKIHISLRSRKCTGYHECNCFCRFSFYWSWELTGDVDLRANGITFAGERWAVATSRKKCWH